MKIIRRKLLNLAILAVISTGIAAFKPAGKVKVPVNQGMEIIFLSPVDGDMLNEYDGKLSDGGLITKVRIAAPSGSKLKVNGIRATYSDGIFLADAKLKHYENNIVVTDGIKGHRKSMKVFWLKNYVNKFRFSIDDNIWFLKDINQNSGRYKSIFENPYLGFLKQVHDKYGAKIHLNLFYQTEGFNLSQMTAKFKEEWKANSDWLGLSFHALAEFPDKPYINAGYDQVKNDCALVTDQIRRFAGEEVMGKETTLHWGEGTAEACRALRDQGYTVLAGYFNVDDKQAAVSYYLNEEQRRHLKTRFIWRDNKEGIIFAKIALVVNTVKLEQVVSYLDNVKKMYNPHYIDLMIHEQYFYPNYGSFQPDWREKVMTAVKWAVDNGYQPGFLKESVF
jgi:hypothetical protein